MPEVDLITKLVDLGPVAVLAGVLLYLGKLYAPHLSAFNTNLLGLTAAIKVLADRVGDVEADVGAIKEDIAGLYALAEAERPSRSSRPAPRRRAAEANQ